MHTVELYRKVRLACRDGMSVRAAALHFGISRESVKKMLRFSVPPGYRRTAPVRRPKLDGFAKSLDSFDFKAIPCAEQGAGAGVGALRVDRAARERHCPRPLAIWHARHSVCRLPRS